MMRSVTAEGRRDDSPAAADVHVDLPSDLTAPGAAPWATRATLRQWALARLVEPVTLVVSELVTNAVRHGRPPVWLRLLRREHGVRVAVHDEDPATPAGGPASQEAENGRGLAIVQALAVDSGCSDVPGDGKIVWAEVAVTVEDSQPTDTQPTDTRPTV